MMAISRFVLMLFAFASVLGCRSTSAQNETALKADGVVAHHQGPLEPPAGHGMLLFGSKTAYVSHLPLFGGVHSWQLIMEVEFTNDAGENVTEMYAQDRADHPDEKVYTLDPAAFSLPRLFVEENPLRTFKGTIFRGHFERGGTPIFRNVVVNVRTIVHQKKLVANEPALPALKYLLFGKGEESWVAHFIQRRPSFDHVAAVTEVAGVTPEQLEGGVTVAFAGRPDRKERRVMAGEQAAGLTPSGGNVSFKGDADVYYEVNELQ